MSTKKRVYFFGGGQTDGQESERNLVGGKGANLAEMVAIGIPVPPGFTITTEACVEFYSNNEQWVEGLEDQVKENIARLEETMGAKFGDKENPLLVSVRSGARVSMPGMMDTVLNLGLNDVTVEALAKSPTTHVLLGTLTVVLSRCTATLSWVLTMTSSKQHWPRSGKSRVCNWTTNCP